MTGALGELAAAASMAAATCGPNATEVDEDIDGRVSTFGDQTPGSQGVWGLGLVVLVHRSRCGVVRCYVCLLLPGVPKLTWRYNDYFLSRKLLIGEGEIGNDIQCAVDVGAWKDMGV